MNKAELQNSASLLPCVSEEAIADYKSKSTMLVGHLNEILLSSTSIENLIGSDNIDLMKTNHENHATFMASIFENPNAEILVNTILWVFKVYRNRGFSPLYWQEQLQGWITVIEKYIDTEYQSSIIEHYKWMLNHVESFTELSNLEVKIE